MNAPWFSVARHFLGLAEVSGSTDNPKIVEMFRVSGHPEIDDDETAWCAAFVGACLRLSGYKGSNSLGARSYQRFGQDLGNQPRKGCIVVFTRGNPKAATGHVAFFDHEDNDEVFVLGGNQSDKVCISRYPKSRLLAYRWPVEIAPLPDSALPTILEIDPANAPPHVLAGPRQSIPTVEGLGGAPPDQNIADVQARLASMGFDPGPIDGEFGPLTSAAIVAFQASRGLAQTGVADPQTRQALGLATGQFGSGQRGLGGAGGLSDGLLQSIVNILAARQTAATPRPASEAADNQLLQLALAALLGRQQAPGPVGTAGPAPLWPPTRTGLPSGAAPPADAIMSPIDKILGGSALAGSKTLIAALSYVALTVLQANDVVGTAMGPTATPAGQILTTLIGAFGGLGVVAKLDRLVRVLGAVALDASRRP